MLILLLDWVLFKIASDLYNCTFVYNYIFEFYKCRRDTQKLYILYFYWMDEYSTPLCLYFLILFLSHICAERGSYLVLWL